MVWRRPAVAPASASAAATNDRRRSMAGLALQVITIQNERGRSGFAAARSEPEIRPPALRAPLGLPGARALAAGPGAAAEIAGELAGAVGSLFAAAHRHVDAAVRCHAARHVEGALAAIADR